MRHRVEITPSREGAVLLPWWRLTLAVLLCIFSILRKGHLVAHGCRCGHLTERQHGVDEPTDIQLGCGCRQRSSCQLDKGEARQIVDVDPSGRQIQQPVHYDLLLTRDALHLFCFFWLLSLCLSLWLLCLSLFWLPLDHHRTFPGRLKACCRCRDILASFQPFSLLWRGRGLWWLWWLCRLWWLWWLRRLCSGGWSGWLCWRGRGWWFCRRLR
mmetsp:Transcript_9865/g.24003  ORF Transcript_9865/g.24003 Transcript_9865/m.24003 type:complete len:213 (+) Transcript_9865:764-1402(+)